MKKIILNLQFLFKPSYWVMNEQYSKEMDSLMNELLDKFDFTEINHYTAKLGETLIWITNRPYSCMIPYNYKFKKFNCRASRLTIQKGIRKLNGIDISGFHEEIQEIRKANGLIS